MVEKVLSKLVVLMMVLSVGYVLFAGDSAITSTGFVVADTTDDQNIACSDSDGNDPWTKGIIISPIYEDYIEEDRCIGESLLEFYCDSTGPDAELFNCPNGCSEGACIP